MIRKNFMEKAKAQEDFSLNIMIISVNVEVITAGQIQIS